jgi:hypothetical protein
MPFDHGRRLDNRQRIANAKPIEANKNQSVDGAEGLFLRSGSPQNVYLLPQRQNFRLERRPRAKQIDDRPTNEPDKISHPATASPDSRSTASQIEFATGTGYEPLRRNRRRRLDELRTGDGRPLPKHLKAQIRRELDRLELLLKQIKVVETERDALLVAQQIAAPAPAAMLLAIKGIGPEFAPILWSEGFFRHFDNRRQIASYACLAPTPWKSGSIDREQGVSKAGNPRLRTTLIQLAWLWLRHQPQSALALWFKERVVRNGGRLKKATIVALARKLLVALWKYVAAGVVIEGAIVKAV